MVIMPKSVRKTCFYVRLEWDHSFGSVVCPALLSSACGFLWGKSAFEELFVDDTKRDGFSQFCFVVFVLYMVKAGDEINVSLQDS